MACFLGSTPQIADMDVTAVLGFVAGILTSISSLPQLVKIIKEKKADDVSKLMFVVLSAGVGLWAIYGFLKSDYPVLIANTFSFLINITTAILRKRYSRE
jgi:MtN3 and saliva related transmembrane protein